VGSRGLGRGRNPSGAVPTPDTAERGERFIGISSNRSAIASVWEGVRPDRPGPDDPGGNAVSRFAPLITLGTVAALGGGLLLVNTAVLGQPATTAGTAVAAPPSVVAEVAPGAVPDAGPDAGPAPDAAAPPVPPAAAPVAPAVVQAAYTGRSAGNEVTVALAVKDGKAVAYVCDGKKVEAWLDGTITGADLQLSGADGKPGITATVTDAATLGTVTVGGEDLPFAAEHVATPAGLYEGRTAVRGVLTRIGWIVDEDGKVTGVANAGGARRPAPALNPTNPAATTIDGVPVKVTALDGSAPVVGR
jgi:hypothetical protein